MQIAVYARPFAPSIGGLESITGLLARGLSESGHAVTVYTETHAEQRRDESTGFEVVRHAGPIRLLMDFHRSDVIVMMGVSLRVLPIAVLSGTGVVLTHHGPYRGRGIYRRFVATLKRTCTRWFANVSVSRFVAATIPGRSAVIPNAYDERVFSLDNASRRRRDFIFCGRLVSEKGADLFIEALRVVARARPDVSASVVGDGPERADLEARVQRAGIAGQIDFLGWLQGHRLAAVMAKHSILVVPSRAEEGFGIVALEGLASGCRVIVSDRGGLPEAVGRWGRTCAVNSGAIADAMTRELEAAGQPDDGWLIGAARHVFRHRAGRVAARYLRVLRIVAGTKSPGRR